MRISVIAAVARNGVIGAGGKMPWRLKSDLARFKQLTLGKPVVMGRKTFVSIGRPLPGRPNVVVTRQAGFRAEGVSVAPDLRAGLAIGATLAEASGANEVMVIGGGEIYAEALPLADRLYITHVEATPAGDAYFPAIDAREWRVVSSEPVAARPDDSEATTFTTYDRVAPAGSG